MTTYYSNDFEGSADFAIPPGWQAEAGGVSGWMVRDVPSLATNGTKVLTSPGSSYGYPVEFVGAGDKDVACYEFFQKVAINGANQYVISVAHTNNIAGNPTDFNYRALFSGTLTSITADISPFLLGVYPGIVATGTRPMAVAAGDRIGVRYEVDKKKVSVWVWNDSHEARPTDPLATWTDTVQRAPGHFGCYWTTAGVLVGLDQLVISDAVTGAGGGGGSSLSAGATGAAIASGTANASLSSPAAGTITISDFRDLTTGVLRSNESGITVIVNDLTTGALVALKSAQTTNASADCVVSDAALVAGTTYRVTTILADGSEGTWKYTAS